MRANLLFRGPSPYYPVGEIEVAGERVAATGARCRCASRRRSTGRRWPAGCSAPRRARTSARSPPPRSPAARSPPERLRPSAREPVPLRRSCDRYVDWYSSAPARLTRPWPGSRHRGASTRGRRVAPTARRFGVGSSTCAAGVSGGPRASRPLAGAGSSPAPACRPGGRARRQPRLPRHRPGREPAAQHARRLATSTSARATTPTAPQECAHLLRGAATSQFGFSPDSAQIAPGRPRPLLRLQPADARLDGQLDAQRREANQAADADGNPLGRCNMISGVRADTAWKYFNQAPPTIRACRATPTSRSRSSTPAPAGRTRS